MTSTVPSISQEEIRSILKGLEAKGFLIPEPQSVEVEAGLDHEGDPVFFMTVFFAKRLKPESLRWSLISPLIDALRSRIFIGGGESCPVIAKVIRLGEKRPK